MLYVEGSYDDFWNDFTDNETSMNVWIRYTNPTAEPTSDPTANPTGIPSKLPTKEPTAESGLLQCTYAYGCIIVIMF